MRGLTVHLELLAIVLLLVDLLLHSTSQGETQLSLPAESPLVLLLVYWIIGYTYAFAYYSVHFQTTFLTTTFIKLFHRIVRMFAAILYQYTVTLFL